MVRRPPFAPVLAGLSLLVSACAGGDSTGPHATGPCTGDGDCTEARPYCVDASCVGCRGPADCGYDAPACVAGACTSCSGDDACEGRTDATRCDLAAGTCVQCLDDAGCAAPTPRCGADHRCVECTVASDCASGSCQDGVCGEGTPCVTGEDCGAGELCVMVEGAVEGRCEQACDVRTGGPCDGGELCAWIGFGPSPDFEPVGICQPPNGGAAVGATCGDGEHFCEANLVCVNLGPDATAGTCLAICDEADPDSCADPADECISLEIAQPVGATLGACLPRSSACTTDADCADDEVCGIDSAGAGAIALGCMPARGGKRGGEACGADVECASSFCVAGVCFGTCAADPDCHGASACVDLGFNLADGTYAEVPACLATCADDAACGAARVCLPWPSHDGERLLDVCGPSTGTVGPGGACLRNESCKSGFCYTGTPQGYCLGVCDGDEDCGANTTCQPASYYLGGGPDGLGGTSDDLYGLTRTCAGPPCGADADCAGSGWACTPLSGGADPGQLFLRCHPGQGEKRGGEACVENQECRSGQCFDPTMPGEDCEDGVDNDGNGRTDCDDPACLERCTTEHACANGLDDDGDGAADCADGDCENACEYESACANGLDDDGDRLTDCADPDCRYSCNLVELDCQNGGDDDGDGAIDCLDPDCRYYSVCQESDCTNGADDDGNGFVDCQDPDCRWMSPCNARPAEGESDPAQCGNGADDDLDGLTDCADPSCEGRGPCAEAGCALGDCCHDGIDEDGDGAVDCADSDCHSAAGCHEASCSDGLDDDGDGPVDCKDPDCANDPACNERNCAGTNCCANGIDDDGDGGIDCVDAQCRYTAACHEMYCNSSDCCADGLDGDGDGYLDCDDIDCRYASSCYEFSCDDGVDNDGDGATDCQDFDCHSDRSCRPLWFVCFEACAADADCAGDRTCAAAAAGFPAPEGRDYFAACLGAAVP